MRPFDSLFTVLAMAALAVPTSGLAQIPGGNPNEAFERRDAARMEYRAAVLQRVNETLNDWADAWLDDATGDLMDTYTERPRVRGLAFGFASGREELEERFAQFLPRAGDIRVNIREFNASGRMAYGVAEYVFQSLDEDGAGRMTRGTVMTVFLKQGGWKIHSQLFVPDDRGVEG